MRANRIFFNSISSIIWLIFFVMFVNNPQSIKPFVVGTSLALLSLQFALHVGNDLINKK